MRGRYVDHKSRLSHRRSVSPVVASGQNCHRHGVRLFLPVVGGEGDNVTDSITWSPALRVLPIHQGPTVDNIPTALRDTAGALGSRTGRGPATNQGSRDFPVSLTGPDNFMAETVGGHVTPVDQWGPLARNNRAPYVARMYTNRRSAMRKKK